MKGLGCFAKLRQSLGGRLSTGLLYARINRLKKHFSFLVIIGCVLGLAFWLEQRRQACRFLPLLAPELLPNAAFGLGKADAKLPQGWLGNAPGVQMGHFAVDNDQRSLQLMGLANFVQAPPIPVQPQRAYCFTGQALTDSPLKSATRLRIVFQWLDATSKVIQTDRTAWQSVVLWQAQTPPKAWSQIKAAFVAPQIAKTLILRIEPAADDRIYVDNLHVQEGGQPEASFRPAESAKIMWPEGKKAAVSFSFDWETTMAGLIHSRSVGDPYTATDPVQRGWRMREGVTTTLAILRPYGLRATYYASGYNFLWGNSERKQFLGNPTYQWANKQNRWPTNYWQTTPWFAPDPYGTVSSHPEWYFGDLISLLQREKQDIQSHTFSHFYGGFVPASEWQADLQAWKMLAATQNVSNAVSLAFPWSSSGGMSDASWQALAEAKIASVTRLSKQAQSNLFPQDKRGMTLKPHCEPLPSRPQILACPDFYLTAQNADVALAQLEKTVEVGGAIDIWAHTEEVISPEQQAAWRKVVAYAVNRGDLWIAPLREIAAWQQGIREK